MAYEVDAVTADPNAAMALAVMAAPWAWLPAVCPSKAVEGYKRVVPADGPSRGAER